MGRRLEPRQLFAALAARDRRFDGVFFVAVTSTRIYCRPICPAPTPRPEHCRFFASAAAAERRGFRPCLRCRPELAPGQRVAQRSGLDGRRTVDALAQLARVAATRIAAGALDGGGVERLATELGVTGRHLRRAVERDLGASPVALAQTRRLLTAKHLLADTELPITRVALTSGFQSVRRFNALIRARYRMSPTELRRSAQSCGAWVRGPRGPATGMVALPLAGTISLALAYRPPFDWEAALRYLAARATPGVEAVTADGRYWRTVRIDGHAGYFVVRPGAMPKRGASALRAHTLVVDVSSSLLPVLSPLLGRLRSLFDLDADPRAIASHLSADPGLASHVERRPGLRVLGTADPFDLALRTVLGQQVSVRGATTLAARLAALVSQALPASAAPVDGLDTIPVTRLPVAACDLAAAGADAVASIGLPRARAACVVALARAVADGELPELVAGGPCMTTAAFVRRFTALPGIGPWTAEYVAMRALQWPDAFPDGDLGLRKAAGGLTPARLRTMADRWRPWRSYAAFHLWASLDTRSSAHQPTIDDSPRSLCPRPPTSRPSTVRSDRSLSPLTALG